MKKIIALLLVFFMLAFVVACGDDPIETESGNTDTKTSDSQLDTDKDTDSETDTDTDIGSDTGSEDKNEILGPGWTAPQKWYDKN